MLTTKEVASRLGVHKDTVRRWRREGRGVVTARKVGGRYLYPERDVERVEGESPRESSAPLGS